MLKTSYYLPDGFQSQVLAGFLSHTLNATFRTARPEALDLSGMGKLIERLATANETILIVSTEQEGLIGKIREVSGHTIYFIRDGRARIITFPLNSVVFVIYNEE